MQFNHMNVQLHESTRIRFDNGVVQGTGWIRGIVNTPLPVIGSTYIVEIEKSNIDTKTYPYSCVGLFACHIMELLNLPVADMMDEGTVPPQKDEEEGFPTCDIHGTDEENFEECTNCGWITCISCEPYGCMCYTR